MDKSQGSRFTFRLKDLLVFVFVVGVMFSLCFPAIESSRAASRRQSCSANFKQIGLAVQQYHSAFSCLPMHGTGPTSEFSDDPVVAMQPGMGYSRHQLSYLVSILSFCEGQRLWEEISNAHLDKNGNQWPAFGPAPYTANYQPWNTNIAQYRCPSDFAPQASTLGRTNYAACVGDSMWRTDNSSWSYFKGSGWRYNGSNRLRAQQVNSSVRGAFVPRRQMRFKDILDGVSNTILAGEIATSLGDRDVRTRGSLMNGKSNVLGNPKYCVDDGQVDKAMKFWTSDADLTEDLASRGSRWADFRPIFTQVNTILPPNSEVCIRGTHGQDGVMPLSSRHVGGAHILLCDGAVIFMTDFVESGDARAGVVYYRNNGDQNSVGRKSPYGLWGALGTRSAKENIAEG